MVTPLKSSGGDGDPRPQGRRGAAAAGGTEDPRRRRRLALWLLLAALIVAAAVVGIVLAATSSKPTASPSRQATTGGAGSAQASAGSAQASAGSTGSAQAAGLPPFGLVGGGGVTPRSATGKLAVAGSVGDVLFAEDGTALDSSAMKVITTAAQEIGQHQLTAVTVVGYTDAVGNAASNTQLSLERAEAVIAALRPLGGSAVQYHAEARGQGQPVAANSTAAGRQLNRRVVITSG